MSDLIGACTSCGRMVKAQIRFIGKPSYHCKEPSCWPLSLWLMDKSNWAQDIINDIQSKTQKDQ